MFWGAGGWHGVLGLQAVPMHHEAGGSGEPHTQSAASWSPFPPPRPPPAAPRPQGRLCGVSRGAAALILAGCEWAGRAVGFLLSGEIKPPAVSHCSLTRCGLGGRGSTHMGQRACFGLWGGRGQAGEKGRTRAHRCSREQLRSPGNLHHCLRGQVRVLGSRALLRSAPAPCKEGLGLRTPHPTSGQLTGPVPRSQGAAQGGPAPPPTPTPVHS